ncbi:MAG: DUF6339 family protein [Cyclobacteriaceae bacterium]
MQKIRVFTRSFTDRLYKDSQDHPGNYLNNKIIISEEAFALGVTGIEIDQGVIDEINKSQGSPKEDFINSIRVFESLDINLTTASDPRLWTCLTHTVFWEYMRKRWDLESRDINGQKSRIRDRYHLRNLSLNNLSRNGISRLWWMAYLTVDEERKDKYELTKILTSRQDLIAGLLERYLGSNNNIRKSILRFLAEQKGFLDNEDQRRELLKKINLVGGVKNLPLMDESDIYNEIGKIA